MAKAKSTPVIRLRGVRHNNLKNFDLDLPLNRLIVITGLSGSGKSSLAFDTLFAEGQRRYIETFSPYARQFFDRMDKPQVDSIDGIPPAIAIEQRNAVRTTRSTVGTMTEICDYLKSLWPLIAQLHCRQCGQVVRKDSPQSIWRRLAVEAGAGAVSSGSSPSVSPPESEPGEALVTFDLPLSEKLSLEESLELITRQGYQRLLLDQEIVRVEDSLERLANVKPARLTIVQDRVRLAPDNRARFVEACEQAYHFGKGKLAVHVADFAPGTTPHVPDPPPTDSTVQRSNRSNLQPSSRPRPDPLNGSTVQRFNGSPFRFSNRLHCAPCDLEYRDPTPALFSFNHPVGACPTCRGFGRVISIDYDLAIPDRSKTLAEGAVKPWQTGQSAECQEDLMKFCKLRGVPVNVPFARLQRHWQDWVIEGDPDYGKDSRHEWPHAWYGVKGYFRWLESKAYKMHVRVLLSRYRSYQTCADCRGNRFQPESLLFKVAIPPNQRGTGGSPMALGTMPKPRQNEPVTLGTMPKPRQDGSRAGNGAEANRKFADERPLDRATDSKRQAESELMTLADFYRLPIRDALKIIERLAENHRPAPSDPLGVLLSEVQSRLAYLDEVGLGYLTLDRPTRTLSGGETERVNLTTCLGSRLVNTLFVLDEPSIGLHPRDTDRLVKILHGLRSAGNTLVVVEHEPGVIRAADQIVDLGPGHGESGGQVVFQGTVSEILRSRPSLTGQYLSGTRRIELPPRRAWDPSMPRLSLTGATRHNLKNVSVEFPLNRLVCVTGVSGSGKTTLVREVLLPILEAKLRGASPEAKASDRLDADEENGRDEEASVSSNEATLRGWESLTRIVLADQSPLGKTPRSNPAVYIGAFDEIRELFAASEAARQRGLNASAFSFNSSQGQCERCRGAGFEKIEMQFLSDVFIRCPDCNGRRYRPHVLEVKLSAPGRGARVPDRGLSRKRARPPASSEPVAWSIADLLDATVDEAIPFLSAFNESRPARRAVEALGLLQEVGLGYLRLGQPINTLSGGESQRLKLVGHLAECSAGQAADPKPALLLFDEPTTGLHFDDVRVLLRVFQRLVDAGHSVVVIEHNLEVIKSADWVIDLGPDAGDQGGAVVACGPPEAIAACAASHTGRALRSMGIGAGGRLGLESFSGSSLNNP